MADATHLSLKVKLDDDIRRFSVVKSINFAELHALIAKHFVLAPENVQVKYIDDEEELITLGSDLELEEAKRLQPTVLRLNVYDSTPRRRTTEQPLGGTPDLEAAFVRDVTVPDGTNVSAKVKFQKLWCIKNTGSTTWPKGVVLKTVDPKDDQLLAFSTGAINRAVGPGEEAVIGVDLQAPARPGRCVQHWRLFTEDGTAFGSRLWVDVTVCPSPQHDEAAERKLAEAQAEAKRQAEQAELEQLLKEDEEAKRRDEEEAAARRAEEERLELERLMLEVKRQEEERLLEEEQMRLKEEEELRKQQEEEMRKHEEEEKKRKREEEEEQMRRLMEEEKKRQEEELRKQQEEEMRKREEEEEEKRKREEEEEKKRKLLNSKYPGQLTALAEMGFTDVAHNVKLLDKHKGSLDLALEALLSGH